MYHIPHNKIHGVTLSNKPQEGIPIALSTIQDYESHYVDYVKSSCYLAYRCLDGTYFDYKNVLEYLCKAHSIIEKLSLENKEPKWFTARWTCSLYMAKVYMKICCLEEDLPLEDTKIVADSDCPMICPAQIVNVLRANSMLILHHGSQNDLNSLDKQIYEVSFPMFSKSMIRYSPRKDTDGKTNMANQIAEACECMHFIMKMRNSYIGTDDHRKWIIDFISERKTIPLKDVYYKTIQILFNKTNKLQTL